MPTRLPWPDVPRLLQKRQDFLGLEAALASSVTAFLAWKAFLIVARGGFQGSEKNQCSELISTALSRHPSLWPCARNFATSLKPLANESPAVVADWYAEESWEPDARERRVSWAKRTLREMAAANEHEKGGSRLLEHLSDHAYAVRSAVLAHGAIHTTANHFERIVPAFEVFVSHVACAGWAERARLSLDAAMMECRLNA